jgi:hypothetical protein
MKFFAGLIALTLAVPGLAHAAGNLSGTYSLRLTEVCQSIDNELFKPSTVINTIDPGTAQQTIGLITLTPSKAGALFGTVAATFTQANGTLTVLGLPGPPKSPAVPNVQIGTKSVTGTYSMTVAAGLAPSSFKITFKGDTLNSFTAYFSQLSGSTYLHAEILNIESNNETAPSCSQAGTLQHS